MAMACSMVSAASGAGLAVGAAAGGGVSGAALASKPSNAVAAASVKAIRGIIEIVLRERGGASLSPRRARRPEPNHMSKSS